MIDGAKGKGRLSSMTKPLCLLYRKLRCALVDLWPANPSELEARLRCLITARKKNHTHTRALTRRF